MDVDLLFNKLKQYNDLKLVAQEARIMIVELIYLCLKYRYCYQIGMTQQEEWIDRLRELELYYSNFYDYSLFNKIDFLNNGESLQKIYNDVVHLLNRQGFHDIPDLAYLFTIKNICNDIHYDCGVIDFINGLWLRKYARGYRIKRYLCMVD